MALPRASLASRFLVRRLVALGILHTRLDERPWQTTSLTLIAPTSRSLVILAVGRSVLFAVARHRKSSPSKCKLSILEGEVGIINHNAMVITTWSDRCAREFLDWIDLLAKGDRSLIVRVESRINVYHTFFVGPDGSQEHWDESHEGDLLRDRIVERLSRDNRSDGSSPWKWVEVSFGEYGQKIVRGNCEGS